METNLLREIKQKIVLLPPEDQLELADFLTENAKRATSAQPFVDQSIDKLRRREQEWIEKNKNQYAGQWVALDGDDLLSFGQDGRKVYAEAKSKGVKVPFVVHLEPLDEMPFGGW